MKLFGFILLAVVFVTVESQSGSGLPVNFPATKVLTKAVLSFTSASDDKVIFYFNKLGEVCLHGLQKTILRCFW